MFSLHQFILWDVYCKSLSFFVVVEFVVSEVTVSLTFEPKSNQVILEFEWMLRHVLKFPRGILEIFLSQE